MIIDKLCSRYAEDRYKTPTGLLDDLSRCEDTYRQTGKIPLFYPGMTDVREQLDFPNGQYGRHHTESEFRNTIDHALQSRQVSVICVPGQAGLGKTSFVRSVLNRLPMDTHVGYGKSGQGVNQPLGVIKDACSDMAQNLDPTAPETQSFAQALKTKLHQNQGVLLNFIPGLAPILGDCPRMPSLDPEGERNRFNLAFQEFIQHLGDLARPTVLVLDDWQWCDPNSLELIQLLLDRETPAPLVIIGLYRDDELVESPILSPLVHRITESKQTHVFTLNPVDEESVSEFISDIFSVDLPSSQMLAKLVSDKTHGNPLFIKQLLESLVDQDVIQFDTQSRTWKIDTEKAAQSPVSDNVAELVASRIDKLPTHVRRCLGVASIYGSRFNATEIANLDTTDTTMVQLYARAAETQGYIVQIDDAHRYQFLHDRIEAAAYATLDPSEASALHVKVGKSLVDTHSLSDATAHIYGIANHLNKGADNLSTNADKRLLGQANYLAGCRAKTETGYAKALGYFEQAERYFDYVEPSDKDQLQFDIPFKIAQCLFLTQQFDVANQKLDTLASSMALSDRQKTEVVVLRAAMASNQSRHRDAYEICRTGLQEFGIHIPETISKLRLVWALVTGVLAARKLVKQHQDGTLRETTDEHAVLVQRILMGMTGPSYFLGAEVFGYLVLRSILIVQKQGVTDIAPYFFTAYAVIMDGVFGWYWTGRESAKIAIELLPGCQDLEVRAKVKFAYGTLVGHRFEPIHVCINYTTDAMTDAYASGDNVYLAYMLENILSLQAFRGDPIASYQAQIQEFIGLLRAIDNVEYMDLANHLNEVAQVLDSDLKGGIPSLRNLEKKEKILDDRGSINSKNMKNMARTLIHYAFEEPEEARRYFIPDALLGDSVGAVQVTEYVMVESLVLMGLWPKLSLKEKLTAYIRIKRIKEKVKKWAKLCPETYLCRLNLFLGEECVWKGKSDSAIRYYRLAIEEAQQHGFEHIKKIAALKLSKIIN